MIFYGTPNQVVSMYTKRNVNGRKKPKLKVIAKFDENGKYETDDKLKINKMKHKFECGTFDYKELSYAELKSATDFNTWGLKREEIIKQIHDKIREGG